MADPTQASLRDVMSQFATGVTVITTGGTHVHGMTANAFTSVSLEPPLVLCCVGDSTRIRTTISSSGQFGVSVLGAGEQELARHFANRNRPAGVAQFERVDWWSGPRTGAPLLAGSLAWLECDVAEIYGGGDHVIVLGRVLNVLRGSAADALVFFGGGFHQVSLPMPRAA